MIKQELENIILTYLNDDLGAGAYIVGQKVTGSLKPKFKDDEIIIEMSNKSDIELGTLGFISTLANTSDITFHLEIRYSDYDRFGIITIKDFIL